jgi:hypothetical protein
MIGVVLLTHFTPACRAQVPYLHLVVYSTTSLNCHILRDPMTAALLVYCCTVVAYLQECFSVHHEKNNFPKLSVGVMKGSNAKRGVKIRCFVMTRSAWYFVLMQTVVSAYTMTALFISPLVRSDWSISLPFCFTPGYNPGTHWVGGLMYATGRRFGKLKTSCSCTNSDPVPSSPWVHRQAFAKLIFNFILSLGARKQKHTYTYMSVL